MAELSNKCNIKVILLRYERTILAVEMSDMCENSPIRRAVIYENKAIGAPLAPKDSILSRIAALKKMDLQTSTTTQMSIEDLQQGREQEKSATAFGALLSDRCLLKFHITLPRKID